MLFDTAALVLSLNPQLGGDEFDSFMTGCADVAAKAKDGGEIDSLDLGEKSLDFSYDPPKGGSRKYMASITGARTSPMDMLHVNYSAAKHRRRPSPLQFTKELSASPPTHQSPNSLSLTPLSLTPRSTPQTPLGQSYSLHGSRECDSGFSSEASGTPHSPFLPTTMISSRKFSPSSQSPLAKSSSPVFFTFDNSPKSRHGISTLAQQSFPSRAYERQPLGRHSSISSGAFSSGASDQTTPTLPPTSRMVTSNSDQHQFCKNSLDQDSHCPSSEIRSLWSETGTLRSKKTNSAVAGRADDVRFSSPKGRQRKFKDHDYVNFPPLEGVKVVRAEGRPEIGFPLNVQGVSTQMPALQHQNVNPRHFGELSIVIPPPSSSSSSSNSPSSPKSVELNLETPQKTQKTFYRTKYAAIDWKKTEALWKVAEERRKMYAASTAGFPHVSSVRRSKSRFFHR